MNETPGHEGGAEPPEQRPIPYVCIDCRRTFSAPAGAPSQMDGLAVEGLTCPWCGKWAVPAQSDRPTVRVKRSVMRTRLVGVVAVILACLVGALGYLAWAEKDDERESGENDPARLAAAVAGATVSLDRGLELAGGQGTPVSAKFEVEDEAFQLSIFVLAGADGRGPSERARRQGEITHGWRRPPGRGGAGQRHEQGHGATSRGRRASPQSE